MLNKMTIRATLIAVAATASVGAHAYADGARQVSVRAGALSEALETLARQCDVYVIYPSEQLKGLKTHGVSGTLETRDAFRKLIEGTPLILREEGGAVLISLPPAPGTGGNKVSDNTAATELQSHDPAGDARPSFWSRFRLAQADDGTTAGALSLSSGGAAGATPPTLEEVVVTAQKREERLQDVPVPVTAIRADTLIERNQVRLQDYYTSVPGLSLAIDDYGAPLLAIRGITTGTFTNPTVGTTVDDVPFGSSTSHGYGQQVFDIDPSDLASIEVLRGPQGTLYGASSLGGLLKYVTVDPSTAGLSGSVEAGTNTVYNATGLGYSVRAAVNIPLGDTLAARVSAFTRRDPGYIDDPVLGVNGVNDTKVSGGRVSALWRPLDTLSIKVSALIQKATSEGLPDVDHQPGLGDLQQNIVKGAGQSSRQIQAYSANVKVKLAGIDVESVSGYGISRPSEWLDFTPVLGTLTQQQFGVSGTPIVLNNPTYKFSQELRLSASLGSRFDWLLGGFYTRENSPEREDVFASNPTTGQIAGQWLHDDLPFTFSEYAAFADLTWHITDRLNLQVGGRESHNTQSYSQKFTGPYVPAFLNTPSPALYPQADSSDDSFTYLVTPQFKFSPDLMVYARLASGYRPGGPNTFATTASGLPSEFKPDKTQNYELGVKGRVPGQPLTFDASAYYISWQDIQINLVDPRTGFAYTANGSAAKSQGLELSMESRPLTGLSISAWVAWNDAELKDAFPVTSAAYGEPGDRLPYSSRFSGNLSIQQDFPLTSRLTGFVGGAVSYASDRTGVFTGSPQRQDLPAYAKTDLRGGVKLDSWTVNVYVNNVTDRRALLNGGIGTFNPIAFQYIQPRTAGLSIATTF